MDSITTPLVKSSQVYFKYLDALRFFAFLGVFYAHTGTIYTNTFVEQIFPINIWLKFTVYGSYGVNFFFVLSGFLITYLLLREKSATKNINIKKFYIKRVLRIWPVYFITLFFGALILPLLISPNTYEVFTMTNPNISLSAFIYNLFFAGNFYQGLWIGMAPLSIGILWSVCVEEQFYLVWPWVIKFFSTDRLAYIIGFLISLTLLYKFLWADDRMANYYLPWSLGMDLGFGSLLGVMYFNNQIKNIIVLMLSILTGSVLLILLTKSNLLETLRLVKTPIIDSIFVLVILFFISNRNYISYKFSNLFSKKGVEIKDKAIDTFVNLGKISYGLYAYHATCLMFTVNILFISGFLDKAVSPIEFYTVAITSFMLTIFIAKYSYKYIESKILNLKDKI